MKKMLAMLLAVGTIVSTSTAAMAAPTAPTDGLSFGESDSVELEGGLLTPGEEYRFPLYITQDGNTAQFTESNMEGHNLRLENTQGKDALESGKMVKIGSDYFFEVKVKAGWPTEQTEVAFKLRYQNKDNGKAVFTKEFDFNTGYGYASDAYLDTLSESDYVQVDENAPVYTKNQLEKISRINGYQKVTFAANDWRFTANVTDMDNVNLLNNTKAITDIIEKFETNDFKFLSFPAGPEFKGNAELQIDVSDIADDFNETFYVYRYLNGKLSKMDSQFHSDEDMLVLNTNKLGRFVITNKEIPDGTVIFGDGSEQNSSSSQSTAEDSSSASSTAPDVEDNTGKPNPETGVGSGAAIAVMALSSAAVVGLLSRKK